ncbi:hypothetical protein ACHAO1_008481 [Botrytis cinerea]
MPGMPGGRVYVVNSPRIRNTLLRSPTKVSARHVDIMFTPKLANLSHAATKVLAHYEIVGEEVPSYLKEGIANVHSTMRPGEALAHASLLSAQNLTVTVEDLAQNNASINLESWAVASMTEAATLAIFGPKNPYKDPEIAKAFWNFQRHASDVMFFPWPQYTCAKAYSAREKVIDAFTKYYAIKGEEFACHWVRGATEISRRYNISDRDKASMDVANTHGILANTAPTAFWMLFHIFSDNTVLKEVRSVVLSLVAQTKTSSGITSYELKLHEICDAPILQSILHECLRLYANGSSTRIIAEDTIQAGYLLKKGSLLFMPNSVFHRDPRLWGPNVRQFDARRFINTKQSRSAFMGFGVGQSLCPGRFLAQNQILFMCVMMAMRFDMKPKTGTWVHPGTDDSDATRNVHPPKQKVTVDIFPRDGWNDGIWKVEV